MSDENRGLSPVVICCYLSGDRAPLVASNGADDVGLRVEWGLAPYFCLRVVNVSKKLCALLIAALCLSVTACAAVENGEAGKALPMPPDTAKISQKLLDANCQLMSTTPPQFELCVRVQAAQLPPLDPARRDHFGEQYSPQKYLECRLKTFTGGNPCEPYRLRRPENPEYWPPSSKRITWPEPPKTSVYRDGMTGREYFAALCEAEAGEFIYKAVDNVEGIYQIRPRVPQEGNPELMDRYVMEDPYGHTAVEAAFYDHPSKLFVNPPWKLYRYLERYETEDSIKYAKNEHGKMKGVMNGEGYYRYSGYEQEISASPIFPQRIPRAGKPMQREMISAPQARYGFTWRGIPRPHDRELGIAGGELAVMDMQTGETLGLRRGFIYSATKGNKSTWWLAGAVCPELTDVRRSKDPEFTYWFVKKVAKPIQSHLEHKGDGK